jgi:transposase
VFVFLNRRKNQVKMIVWTRGGWTIVHKRLERGTFTFPARVLHRSSELTQVCS